MNQTPRRKNSSNVLKLLIPPSPFLERLGYGTGVNVWKMKRQTKTTGPSSPWAVKNVRSGLDEDYTEKYQSLIKKEANILSTIKHENIIQFRGLYTSLDGRKCLAIEMCGSSLGNLIEERADTIGEPYPAAAVHRVGLCVAKALDYLHREKSILHGDIKSYNVLIQGKFEVIKLCDFGVCCPMVNGVTSSFVGTPIYSAPECQEGAEGPVTAKADIFSLGLVLWEMLALQPPHTQDFSDSDSDEDEDSEDSSVIEVPTTSGPEDDDDDVDKESLYGTRPPLPAFPMGPEYNLVLAVFHCCTETEPARRPAAAYLVQQLGLDATKHPMAPIQC